MNEKESTQSCPTKTNWVKEAMKDMEVRAKQSYNAAEAPAAELDKDIFYKFSEDHYLKEIEKYINATYDQHYAQSKYQATDTILDAGYGEGFCMGNILKYWKRYGKKEGKNRKDLLKIIHYAIIQLHIHDAEAYKDYIPFEGSDRAKEAVKKWSGVVGDVQERFAVPTYPTPKYTPPTDAVGHPQSGVITSGPNNPSIGDIVDEQKKKLQAEYDEYIGKTNQKPERQQYIPEKL